MSNLHLIEVGVEPPDFKVRLTPGYDADSIINSFKVAQSDISFHEEYKMNTALFAFKCNDLWRVERSTYVFNDRGYLQVQPVKEGGSVADCVIMAAPLDPRIREQDINDANRIYPNEDGTAWLFSHALIEEHYDRELVLTSLFNSIFEKEISDSMERMLVLLVNNKPSNQQLGHLSQHKRLTDFRNDCVSTSKTNLRNSYLGRHISERDTHYLHKVGIDIFNKVRKNWKENKTSDESSISTTLDRISTQLTSLHQYKTRWDISTANDENESDA